MENVELGSKVVFMESEQGDFRGMKDNIWVIEEVYPPITGKVLIKSLQNPEFVGFHASINGLRPATPHEIKIGHAVRAQEKLYAQNQQHLINLIEQIDTGEVSTMQQVKEALQKLVG